MGLSSARSRQEKDYPAFVTRSCAPARDTGAGGEPFCGPDAIVPLEGTESNARGELGTAAPRESARKKGACGKPDDSQESHVVPGPWSAKPPSGKSRGESHVGAED